MQRFRGGKRYAVSPSKPDKTVRDLFPVPTSFKVKETIQSTISGSVFSAVHYCCSGFTLKIPSNLIEYFVKYWFKL